MPIQLQPEEQGREGSAERSVQVRPGVRSKVPWFLVSTIVVSIALRYPGLLWPLSPDEAGFLEVARNVRPSADSLYGTYWVDRSPVLIGAYWLFDVLAGEYGMRVFAALFVALMITAVYHSGRIMAGVAGARLGAVITAAVLANPEFNAWTGKGEVFGASLVAVTVWMLLVALQRCDRRAMAAALIAGIAGALALGFKQSLAGGVVFAGVLLVSEAIRSPAPRRRKIARLAACFACGALLPVALVVLWVVVTPTDLGTLWYQVFEFRGDASVVIASGNIDAPLDRAAGLWLLARESGLVYGVGVFAIALPWSLKRLPSEVCAVLALVLADVAGIVLGSSYWHAYLIPLIPDVALALAVVLATAGWRQWMAIAVAVLMGIASTRALHEYTETRTSGAAVSSGYNAGRAIAAAARPGDTIISLYGNPTVVEASGLGSPYQHLWSLPMRTLDPDLEELIATLEGDRAPTWIAVVLPLNSWDLDADGAVSEVLARRYVVVTTGCSETIYHLRGPHAPTRINFDCQRRWTAF
jgi:hypothetical protein